MHCFEISRVQLFCDHCCLSSFFKLNLVYSISHLSAAQVKQLVFLGCFQNSVPLELTVKEELPIGSKIGEVQAIDEDEGDNAVIDYAIIGKSNHLDTNITG